MSAALAYRRNWERMEPITADEFLEFEYLAEGKHEFSGGFVRAMAGATEMHEIIALNDVAALHAHLKGKPCRAFKSDMKLRCEWQDGDFFYYPDVMVVCDPTDDHPIYKRRPKLIIEVSSQDWSRDFTEKLAVYRMIPSLDEYVIIDSHTGRPGVTIYRRSKGWEPGERITEGSFTLESMGLTFQVSDLYL